MTWFFNRWLADPERAEARAQSPARMFLILTLVLLAVAITYFSALYLLAH